MKIDHFSRAYQFKDFTHPLFWEDYYSVQDEYRLSGLPTDQVTEIVRLELPLRADESHVSFLLEDFRWNSPSVLGLQYPSDVLATMKEWYYSELLETGESADFKISNWRNALSFRRAAESSETVDGQTLQPLVDFATEVLRAAQVGIGEVTPGDMEDLKEVGAEPVGAILDWSIKVTKSLCFAREEVIMSMSEKQARQSLSGFGSSGHLVGLLSIATTHDFFSPEEIQAAFEKIELSRISLPLNIATTLAWNGVAIWSDGSVSFVKPRSRSIVLDWLNDGLDNFFSDRIIT